MEKDIPSRLQDTQFLLSYLVLVILISKLFHKIIALIRS